MKKIVAAIRKMQLRQILTVFLAGVLLVVTTACNNGDVRGARPNNPPVQMGGQNNPHKMGGDGYTKYKANPAPDLTSQVFDNQLLIAQRTIQSPESREDKMLYRDNSATNADKLPLVNSGDTGLKEIPVDSRKVTRDGGLDEGILEKAGDAFQKSTEFFTEGVDEAFSGSKE